MSDFIDKFKEYQRMAQESMPDRPLDDFMVTISYYDGKLVYYFKVKNHETGYTHQFARYNPNRMIKPTEPQEAIRMMHLTVSERGMKFTAPPKPKKEKPVKEKHERSRLPKNRNKKDDFLLLEALFAGSITTSYGELIPGIQQWFDMSQRSAKLCVRFWLSVGMIIKEGKDRSPVAYYRIGSVPKNENA